MKCPQCQKDIQKGYVVCPWCQVKLSTPDKSSPSRAQTSTQHEGQKADDENPPVKKPDNHLDSMFDNIKIDGIKIKEHTNHSSANISDSLIYDKNTQTNDNRDSTNISDSLIYDKSTHNSTININNYQESRSPAKYRLVKEYPNSGIFPAYQSKDEHGVIVVCKLLPDGFEYPEKLHEFLRNRGLYELIPSFTRYREIWEHEGKAYIIRDYCEGQTMADKLSSKEKIHEQIVLEDRRIWEILVQICRLMRTLAGKPHGGLRPENIFFRQQGDIVLADLYMNRIKDFIADNVPDFKNRLLLSYYQNNHYLTMGKDKDDPQQDVYSLGVIIFECLTGETKDSLVGMHHPERFSKYRSKYNKEADARLLELMDKAVDGTIGPAEFRNLVQRWAPTANSEVRPASFSERKRTGASLGMEL